MRSREAGLGRGASEEAESAAAAMLRVKLLFFVPETGFPPSAVSQIRGLSLNEKALLCAPDLMALFYL
jgi:hypothetical protein